jgi:hypothetical protein
VSESASFLEGSRELACASKTGTARWVRTGYPSRGSFSRGITVLYTLFLGISLGLHQSTLVRKSVEGNN